MLCACKIKLCHRVPLVKVEGFSIVSQFNDMMKATLNVNLVATTQ